ncbi:MAG: hypothetical protein K6B14_11450 [Lachnospiraceae bacterium]|nr:hypothetical protein [Lachnospiraceae bacterium]
MILRITNDFDLKKIADSGQCFRWFEQDDGSYIIPHLGYCLHIRKVTDDTYELSCTGDEYRDVWSHYLDMETDYTRVRSLIPRDTDPFLYNAASSQQGIRILRQDLWETLISFIISQNRNIPAIKNSIELLCALCGEKMTAPDGSIIHAFPSPEAVAALTPDQLDGCRLGYRTRYIHETAAGVVDGSISLTGYEDLSDDECMERLMSITGVGKKVASCVLLFGLHRIDAFPIDVWIRRILDNEYPKGYPMEAYRPYNGIYQQYMFAFYRSIYNEK